MSSVIKNISYSLFANVFSVVISVLTILVLPKVMTMEDYGVWHLFMFYFSYVGFFHFGWIDGIYLRYGGCYYEELDRRVFSAQFYLYVIFLVFISTFANIVLGLGLINNPVVSFIIKIVSLAGVFFCITAFVNFILLLSNRIRDYALNVVLDRFLTIIFLMVFVLSGLTKYDQIIYIKLITCFTMSVYAVFVIQDLVLNKWDNIYNALDETIKNISAGSKLMLSNIAAMLVLGVIRFGIAHGWDIITFGKVSLTLQISNFLMVFITAVSVVLFPILKRIDSDRLTDIYILLRRILTFLLLGLLVTYYPLKMLLGYWLPQYHESLIFMGYLLPFCIFESKMQMLINTYLKSLRQEYLMLKINTCSVAFAVFSTYITVTVMHDLNYAVLAIVANFAFRLFIAEHYVEQLLKINLLRERIVELLVVLSFIFINYHQFAYSALIYLCVYIFYIFINREQVINASREVKSKLGK